MPSGGSISELIPGLKAGDEAAVQRLCEGYFQRLVQLASKELRGKWRRVTDGEDAALSALNSFCERAKRGQFPNLLDRDNLWSLLARITVGKVADYIHREKAKKRGGGAGQGGSAFIPTRRDSSGRELSIEKAMCWIETRHRHRWPSLPTNANTCWGCCGATSFARLPS